MTVSDGRSTVYTIGSTFSAVNNGQPYVDADSCWWKVSREEGWSSPPEMRAEVLTNPVSDGQRSSNILQAARSILLGGTVIAPDQFRLQNAIDKISALLSGAVREDTLTVYEPHLTRHLTVRRDARPSVAKYGPTIATFQIPLVADDPRRLGVPLSDSTFLPSSAGGWTWPFTFPLTIASTVVSGAVSLVNPNSDPNGPVGPVSLRIDGPCTGPVVTHVGTGVQLVFATTLVLAAGEWIDVDMENRTVLANGQASRNGYVTQRGWSGFEPGPNTWAFTAAAYDPASKLTVTATPAWS